MNARKTPRTDKNTLKPEEATPRKKKRREHAANPEPAQSLDDLHTRAFDASPNAVIVLSIVQDVATIVTANRAFEALSGYRVTEITGRSPCFFVGEDHDQPEIDEMRRAMRVGKGTTVTLRTYRRDGGMFWNTIRLAPVCDSSGWVTHFVCSCEDVTLQKAAQTRVRRLEKMGAIGQLASGIAHDFNNILGATGAFADLIAEALPTGSQEHLYAMRIVAASQRATDLVRQLATFTRTKDAPREPLHIRDIVQEVATMLSSRLPQAVNLSIMDMTKDAVVIANSSQLVQVVLNLAVNACDAMSASGGELTIAAVDIAAPEREPLPHQPHMNSENEGFIYATGHLMSARRYVKISVTDNGIGISRDIAERIFEPFFTTKDKRAGSGLGLSIVSNIVSAHDGVVAVRSRPGLGATFHIYLPVHMAPDGQRVPFQPNTGATRKDALRGTERVLIVDDDVDIADALSLSLARWGYRAEALYHPQEALELFAMDPTAWDIVVMDQSMPRMQGTELLRQIKALRPDIKTILCSGNADAPRSEQGKTADAFFIKPASAGMIAEGIRRLMDP